METSEAPMPPRPLSVETILSKSEKSTDNLLMLPKLFGRFAAALSKEILHIASVSPGFVVEGFCRTEAQMVQEVEENATISEVLICGPLRRGLRVTIDRPVVYGLCDLIFGGVGNEPPYVEVRPFSKIERSVMQLFFKTIGRALPAAFPSVATREFFIAPPMDPNEDELYPPVKPFVAVKILCNIHVYSGEMLIELPEELAMLFQPPDERQQKEKVPLASEWGSQISGRIENIDVELVAVLAEFQMSLEGIAKLHAGQMIKLENGISSPLALCSDGIELFTAKLGQSERKFCLSIETALPMGQ